MNATDAGPSQIPVEEGCCKKLLKSPQLYAILFLCSLILTLLLLYLFDKALVLSLIVSLFEWVTLAFFLNKKVETHGIEGGIIYFFVHFLWVMLFLPPTWLTFAGAVLYASLYGFWKGFLCALCIGSAACIAAGAISYLISSSMCFTFFRTFCMERCKVLLAFETAVTERGYLLCFLLRFTPIPSAVLNYGLGLLRGMEFKKFATGFLSTIVVLAAYCYIGASAKNILDAFQGSYSLSEVETALLVVGAVVIVVVCVYVGIRIRQHLSPVATPANNSTV